jgi:hypothetical protein
MGNNNSSLLDTITMSDQVSMDYGAVKMSRIGPALQHYCMKHSFDQLLNAKLFQTVFEGIFGKQTSFHFQQFGSTWAVSGLEVFACLYLLCEADELSLDDKLDALIALFQFNPVPELVVNNFTHNRPDDFVMVDQVKLMFQCVVYGIYRLAGIRKLPTADTTNSIAEQFFATNEGGFVSKSDWISVKYQILNSRPVFGFLEQFMSALHVPTLLIDLNTICHNVETKASFVFGYQGHAAVQALSQTEEPLNPENPATTANNAGVDQDPNTLEKSSSTDLLLLSVSSSTSQFPSVKPSSKGSRGRRSTKRASFTPSKSGKQHANSSKLNDTDGHDDSIGSPRPSSSHKDRSPRPSSIQKEKIHSPTTAPVQIADGSTEAAEDELVSANSSKKQLEAPRKSVMPRSSRKSTKFNRQSMKGKPLKDSIRKDKVERTDHEKDLETLVQKLTALEIPEIEQNVGPLSVDEDADDGFKDDKFESDAFNFSEVTPVEKNETNALASKEPSPAIATPSRKPVDTFVAGSTPSSAKESRPRTHLEKAPTSSPRARLTMHSPVVVHYEDKHTLHTQLEASVGKTPKQKCIDILCHLATSTSSYGLDYKELGALDEAIEAIVSKPGEMHRSLLTYVCRTICSFNIVSSATSSDNCVPADCLVSLVRLCFEPKDIQTSFKYADDDKSQNPTGTSEASPEGAENIDEDGASSNNANELRLMREVAMVMIEIANYRQRQQSIVETLKSYGYSTGSVGKGPARPTSAASSSRAANPKSRSFAASIMLRSLNLSRRGWIEVRMSPQIRQLYGIELHIADNKVAKAADTGRVALDGPTGKLQLYWNELVGGDELLIFQSRLLDYIKACVAHKLRAAVKAKIVPVQYQLLISDENPYRSILNDNYNISSSTAILAENSAGLDAYLASHCQDDEREIVHSNILFTAQEYMRLCDSSCAFKKGASANGKLSGVNLPGDANKEKFVLCDMLNQTRPKLDKLTDDLFVYVRNNLGIVHR